MRQISYKIALLYVSIGLVALSIALLPLSYVYISIKIPINCLYAAFAIFLLCFYKDIVQIKQISFVLICMGVVVSLAYISLLYAEHIDWTKSLIRQYLLEPTLFMVCSFLLTQRLNQKQLYVCFILLCIAIFYHPLATIYDFYANGGGRQLLSYRAKLPHYYIPATAYSFYLIFAFSFAFVAFLKTKRVLKVICGIFMLLSIYAFVCNGGRFAMLSLLLMCCAPFCFFAYKYKKGILLVLIIVLCAMSITLYHASASWKDRFNFYKMVNNFAEVWHTPPAEMGKFLGTYCEKKFTCSPHSLGKQTDITMEYPTLDRISKLKSTLLAIADNPLRPNGYHFQQFPYNIQHIFPLDSINHPFSLTPYKDTFIMAHAHNHNYPSSVFFELGLVGFTAFSLFAGYFLYALYKTRITFSQDANIHHIFIGSIGFAFLGLIVANFFDGFPVREGQLFLFVMLGYFLGHFKILRLKHAE